MALSDSLKMNIFVFFSSIIMLKKKGRTFISIFFSYASGIKIKTGLVSQTPIPWVISETRGPSLSDNLRDSILTEPPGKP